MIPDKYYGRPVWSGKLYLWCRNFVSERALYICNQAWETDIQAVPIPKIIIPIEGRFCVETEEWIAHLESGKKFLLPAKDEKLSDVISWTKRSIQTQLIPGQLTIVKSDYLHRLIGEGKIATLYLSPDSVEGQWLLTCPDYDGGIAVTALPKSKTINLVKQLLLVLCGEQANLSKKEVTVIYNEIVATLESAYKPLSIVPEWLASVGRGIRKRCNLESFQCEPSELYNHITLKDLGAYVERTPKDLRKIFKKYFMTCPSHFKSFMRHVATLQYYAKEWQKKQKHPDIRNLLTKLAAEVHYSDASHLTRDFHDFHGIIPATFFLSTDFVLIDLDAA